MDMTHNPNFDAQIQAAKAKAPGTLKTADIKCLLKAAGKRPTENQTEQIAELIAACPRNQTLVYDLLGELETSAKPNPKVALLKPALWQITETWLSSPPPVGQDLDPMLTWLQSQFDSSADGKPISNDRLRGVSLLVIALHRSPDFFLKCLQAVGPLIGAAARPLGKQQAPKRDPQSGFVMQNLARSMFVAGKGRRPKFAKVVEIASTVEKVLTHLREKEAAANSAIRKLEQVEGALIEQRRITGGQAQVIQQLENDKSSLLARVTNLNAEVEKWKQLHQQIVDHTSSQVAEGKRELLTDLQSKIQPKLGDAKLYANRPDPAVDQVLRLLGEVSQILQAKEVQP